MTAGVTTRTHKRSLGERLHIKTRYGSLTDFGFLLTFLGSILGGLVLVSAICFVAIVYGGRAYGRTTCAHWSTQTGIQTKFVILNWADSGTCLARTPDGHWIVNSRWQSFVNGTKKP